MKQPKPIWIDEAEAIQMTGHKGSIELFRRKVKSGEMRITVTMTSQKAERFYNKLDIENMLIEKSHLKTA